MRKQEAIWRTKHLISQLRRSESRRNFKFNINQFYKMRDCGTVACAAGLAATLPAFNRRGLTLSDFGIPIYRRRGGATVSGVPAVIEFLDVDYDRFQDIFYGDGYFNRPTAGDVAYRIETEILRELEAR